MAGKGTLVLTGRQKDEDGAESVIQCRAAADYYEKDGSHYILYEEKQEDDESVIKNAIKLKGSVLEMTRRGAMRSRMVFEAGKTHRTDYITPYGILAMEVATRTLQVSFQEDRIEIRLSYLLTSDGQFLSSCRLLISLSLL